MSDVILAIPQRLWMYYLRFEMSDIIFYDDYNWIVPTPPLFAKVKYISSVFTWATWLAIIMTIFATTLLYYLGTKNEAGKQVTITISFLNLLGATVVTPANFKLNTNFLRLVILFYMLYAMLVTAYFSGKLSSFLTSPVHEKGISTMDELADSSFRPLIFQSVKDDLISLNSSNSIKLASKTVIYKPMHSTGSLEYIAEHKNVTFDIYQSKLDLNPYFKNKVNVVSGQYLINVEGVMIFRKQYPLLRRLNELILLIHEAGLTKKWVANMATIRFEKSDEFQALTVEHCYSALSLWGFGMMLGAVLFVLERIFGRKCFNRKIVLFEVRDKREVKYWKARRLFFD